MDILELINEAESFRAALEVAKQNLLSVMSQAQSAIAAATADVNQAQADSAAADQALHDVLTSPKCTVDVTTTPPTVTLYSAVDPDSWTKTELDVVG
jgi:hypothetical protein